MNTNTNLLYTKINFEFPHQFQTFSAKGKDIIFLFRTVTVQVQVNSVPTKLVFGAFAFSLESTLRHRNRHYNKNFQCRQPHNEGTASKAFRI